MANPSEPLKPKSNESAPLNVGAPAHVKGGTISMQSRPRPFSKMGKGFPPYDPDAEAAPKTITYEEHYKRSVIPRAMKGGKATSISGTLAVESGRGINRHVITRSFDSWKSLDSLRRTSGHRRMAESCLGRKLMESSDPWAYDQPSTSSTADINTEYTPLMLGPYYRQQGLQDMLDGMSKAYEALHHNPIAKALLRIVTNFVIGTGVKVVCANPLCQQVWDEFDRRRGYTEKMVKLICKELFGVGEIFQHKTHVIGMRRANIELLDASTVWEIVTNPRDIHDVYYLHRQFPTPYQMYTAANVPSAEYVVEQIPANEWTHVMVNNTLGEKRGRSDLFSILGWLKRLKDYANAKIIAAQIQNAIVMKKKIQGTDADLTAVKDDIDLNEAPEPGSVLVENEAIDSSWIGPPGTGEGGTPAVGEFIRSIIAVALNIPPEYLGVQSTAASRAAGLLRAEPAGKLFESRQGVIRGCILDAYNYVIGNAIMSGVLPKEQPKKSSISRALEFMRQGNWQGARAEVQAMERGGGVFREPIDTGAEVVFPEVQPEDRGTYLKDVALGETQGYLSRETAAQLWAQKMSIKDYDYEREREMLKAEAERGEDAGDPSDYLKDDGEPPKGGAEDTANFKRIEKDKPIE
jgi:hypothetical protein